MRRLFSPLLFAVRRRSNPPVARSVHSSRSFPTCVGQQESFLLLFRPVAMDWIAVERILHRQNHSRRSAAPRNLFNHDAVSDVVEARSASSPEAPRLSVRFPRLLKTGRGENVLSRRVLSPAAELPIPRTRARSLQQLLFFRQFQVHCRSLPSGQTLVWIAYSIATPVSCELLRRENRFL